MSDRLTVLTRRSALFASAGVAVGLPSGAWALTAARQVNDNAGLAESVDAYVRQ
jgi:hypothetical protein